MEEHSNSNNFRRHKRSKGAKHRSAAGVVILSCSITLMVLTIALLGNDFLFTAVRKSGNRFSSHVVDDRNSNTDSAANVQNYEDETWNLILVNRWNSIPEDYKVELTELKNGQFVDTRIYSALQKMFDAARSNDVYPIVVSGYRTEKQQQRLLDEKIADYRVKGYSEEKAIAKAKSWVSVPGTSEHQLGLAIDINADGIHSTGKKVYEWLSKNSYKFGFINRYLSGKTKITGIMNEPWHYRYVGIQAATEIYQRGICLEEYLGKVN